jgi:hypothetical protein
MPVLKIEGKSAYVHWDRGLCHVIAFPSQKPICFSKSFQRATRRARNLGYKVSFSLNQTPDRRGRPPRDSRWVAWGIYVLPATKRSKRR